jgi:hypothetical protein
MKEHPDSPFLWAQRAEPSIFLKDPNFRAKRTTLEHADKLNRMHNFTIKQQQAFGAKNLGEPDVKR